MKIKINLLNATLEAKNVKGKHVNKVIDGFFDSLNKKDHVHIVVKPGFESTKTTAKEVKDIVKEVGYTSEATGKTPKTLVASVKESIDQVEKKSVGIKITAAGEKMYRADYICPKCRKKAKRYVIQKSKYLKCHQCATQIRLRSAIPGNFNLEKEPEENEKGAYFLATELYESN